MDTHPCAQVLLGLTLTPQLLCRPVSSRLTSVDFGTNFSFSVDVFSVHVGVKLPYPLTAALPLRVRFSCLVVPCFANVRLLSGEIDTAI